jgi:ABC-type sugar transport system ATPase subunit
VAGIRFEGVSKLFGSVVALDDLSLDVADGEFLVLLGPSGCGKSTALRMVAGLERPTSGTISIGDRVVNDLAPVDRDIAMVFQNYALYPHKSVRQNIEFPLKSRGVPRNERAGLIRSAADTVGLLDLLDRRPRQLSGGQRQRVALARALVRQPAAFLMDEPLSNLDAKLRGETRAELVALHQRLQTTFLYVTHDQVEAMTMGDRVAVMSEGRLQQVDTPTTLYALPRNTFVAAFVGTPGMNLFAPGVFEAGDHVVGVRPEHLRLGTDGIPATVVLVESLGHERLVSSALRNGTKVVARIDAEGEGEGEGEGDSYTLGQAVHLSAESRRIHRFAADTGEALDR